jgi:ATP-dependent helicase HrpA
MKFPERRPLPPFDFPEELPVSAQRDRIVTAIREHPVVIVCGETGSGKTTQLPKICALAGGGTHGLIGHTQPRRIAATSVAARIAQELGSPLGTHVGYKIRFGEQFSAGATIKLMTDGVLLAESQRDPLLRQYDTLIVDEAHERSLNIDFLLGYLKGLLNGPRRHDLKLVITSATIDAERFAAHFAVDGRVAPVIEVSGRLYPVEIRYQGFDETHRDDDDETDLPSRIDEAIETLWREAPGDVLVFLPGEREIRDVAEHLRRLCAREQAARSYSPWARGGVEVLPLFSRLSAADQHRIFAPSNGRRIVLSTNVAETSLTVPGIRYVVDSGLARVKRYRYRGKVEQLQIEPVSQAAANQRAGRCGRVADGVCIRLYDEMDFQGRARFTDPEVLRSSLAGVILRMKALRLSDIESFPFLDPPPRRAIVDGFALLHELGAVDERQRLTRVGEQLARLPVDPRIARILLAGHERGCLREVLIVASALSVQDPRERPMQSPQAADAMHRRFADEHSDFVAFLKLWDYWQAATADRESNRKLAQKLEREFLSARRLREWQDIHSQLSQLVRELRWTVNAEPAPLDSLHRALLTGLLGNLGFKPVDEPLYAGTHQVRFAIHPSSGLTKKTPRWLMAAEIVDTARILARTVARIDPQWVEQAAGHLIQRSWADPHWSKQLGQAAEYERGVLYGLVLYAQRRVALAPREPALARELLIREGLVGEGVDSDKLPFLKHNRRLVAELEKLEEKIRRPDLLVDERLLADWYDARLPADMVSVIALERWYRQSDESVRKSLLLSRVQLLRRDAEGVDSADFPRRLTMRGASFELEYRFDPGAEDDGVTMTVPVILLNQIDPQRCEWLVSGMLRDKVLALLKSLPPRLRRVAVPHADYAREFVERWSDRVGSLSLQAALLDDLAAQRGVRPQPEDFRVETIAAHLFMRFVVIDAHGRRLGASRNLAQLRAEHGERSQGAFRQALSELSARDLSLTPIKERENESASAPPRAPSFDASSAPAPDRGTASMVSVRQAGARYTAWDFGSLPELLELEQRIDGRRQTLIGYPALIDRGDAVELGVFDDDQQARGEHRRGLVRLFALALKDPLKYFERNIPDFQRISIQFAPFGDGECLRRELVEAMLERACLAEPWPADAQAFADRLQEARPRLALIGQELARCVGEILAEHAALGRKLTAARQWPALHQDLTQQVAGLLPARFVSTTPWERLRHLPRYLKAIALRIDKVREDPQRDAQRQAELAPLLQNFSRARAQRKGQLDPRLEDFRWLLEELRVSLFAQTLRTPMPVSVKRLQKAWEGLR